MPTEATEAYARRVPHVTEKGYSYQDLLVSKRAIAPVNYQR